MERTHSNVATDSKELGALLLDIGTSLWKAGANCNRIKVTILKVAKMYDFVPDITIAPNSISLSLNDSDGTTVFNGIRSTPALGINFELISGINALGSTTDEKVVTVQQLKRELEKLQRPHHYRRIITLCFVSLAGAAFCYTFGGSPVEMLITFGATFCGLFIKQQLTKYKTNPYLCTYVAAVVASLFVAIFHVSGLTDSPINAFSTCVLFLVPGVLLINGFTDLIDGNIMNGIAGGVSGLLHSLAIAFGLVTTIIIFNLNG